MSEKVRCSVCVYMPYPGTPLWGKALEMGYVPPTNQEGWCDMDLNRGNTPWMSDDEAQVMCDINDILFVGRSQGHWLLAPYYKLLRWRWRNQYFKNYWEGALKNAAHPFAAQAAHCLDDETHGDVQPDHAQRHHF